MYSVHVVFLLFSCNIYLANLKVIMSNLMPITSRRAEIRNNYTSPGTSFPFEGSCRFLPKRTQNNTVTLYVDLFTDYPIHLVILRGTVLSHGHASISVLLDDKYYKDISFSNESIFSHNPVPSGRVLAISASATIRVCSIEVYTCMSGKTGENCDKECEDGFYGLSCKDQCKCLDPRPCDKITGVCPSGCLSDSVGAPETCYYPVVKVAHFDQVSVTKIAATSITQGPTIDLVSAKVYHPSEQCITVNSQCESKSLFLELDLTKPIALYGVEMTFTKFYLPAPFSMYITSNGKPCYGLTSKNNSLELRRHIFKCHRQNATGKYILVRFSTYNETAVMNATGVEINVCRFKALECTSGFYGRNCRQACNCADNYCDKVTGACLQGRCSINSRGPYCSSINVLPHIIVRKKHHDSRSENSPSQIHNDTQNYFPSWLAIQLDGVYTVHSFTVTLADETDDPHRSIEVFTDPSMSIVNMSVADFHNWPGLPCVVKEPGRGHVTHHLTCPGLARTIVLAVITESSFLEVSSSNIQIWTCVDGMFGANCEHNCNCMDPLERCDKVSGSCLSGCANGYKGRDCLQVCREDDRDPTCPTKTCHCLGVNQDNCGPVVALCEHGCKAGWVGVSCSLPCPKGFFGVNCEERCGNCFYGNQNAKDAMRTCVPTNGTCLLGCADPADTTATCGTTRASPSRPSKQNPYIPSYRAARYQKILEESSIKVILGLAGVIIACATLVTLVCCSLKCYWERLAHNKHLNAKRVEMMVRRAMTHKVDNKIQGDHQAYHEAYMKRDMMKKLGGDQLLDSRSSKARARAKAEAIRLMIVEMETQRRINKGAAGEEEEEDDEQDPDQKVAFWILSQDFSELIDRRRKRLRDYQGNVLHITESPYRISDVSDIPDIHKLYDDLVHLGIP